MRKPRWHIEADAQSYCLSRIRPVRFDLAVEASFPRVRRGRLAQQVRQDMWRRLQQLRGFAPAVLVQRDGDGLKLTAGGRVLGPVPQKARDTLEEMLHDAELRQRWIDWAGRVAQDA